LALLFSACPETSDPPPDGGGDAGMPRIEIGTGDIGEYTTLMDGDETTLIRGSQGGQHVWVGLRAWDLNTRPALIELLLENDASGDSVSIPFQVRLTFQDELPPDADYSQISGLALVVPDPEDVLRQPVTIRARVSENRTGGLMAESSVSGLFIDWDPNNPPGFRPGDDGGVPDGGTFGDGGSPDGGVGDGAVPLDAGT
jgi:hypothetical protein